MSAALFEKYIKDESRIHIQLHFRKVQIFKNFSSSALEILKFPIFLKNPSNQLIKMMFFFFDKNDISVFRI